MAWLVSTVFLFLILTAIVFTLGICRASRQADEMVRRIMDPRLPREPAC